MLCSVILVSLSRSWVFRESEDISRPGSKVLNEHWNQYDILLRYRNGGPLELVSCRLVLCGIADYAERTSDDVASTGSEEGSVLVQVNLLDRPLHVASDRILISICILLTMYRTVGSYCTARLALRTWFSGEILPAYRRAAASTLTPQGSISDNCSLARSVVELRKPSDCGLLCFPLGILSSPGP